MGSEAAGREGPLTGLSYRGPLGKTDWQGGSGSGAQSLVKEQGRRK